MPSILITTDTMNRFKNRTEKYLSDMVLELSEITVDKMLSIAGKDSGVGLSNKMTEIIRSHLKVDGKHKKMGFASAFLRANSKWYAGKGTKKRGKVVYEASMEYKLDTPDYGYAIGSSNGFKFRPSVNVLAEWILQKIGNGSGDFYVVDYKLKNGSLQRTKRKIGSKGNKEEDARDAAWAMLITGAFKKHISLPQWYAFNSKEQQTLMNILRSRANLEFAKSVKELSKKK